MDYREILSDAFNRRRMSNPRYSLRAFARDLCISPSRLSEIFSGKGELSRDKGDVVANKLELTEFQKRDFLDMIDAVSSTNDKHRAAACDRIKSRHGSNSAFKLASSKFSNMAQWQAVAIWSFLSLPAYDGSYDSIAKAFNLNMIDVYDALSNLERAGLIHRTAARWAPVSTTFTTGDSVSSANIRGYHRGLSDLGRKSIDNLTMAQRHLDSLVLSFDRSKYGEVQQKIAAFVQEISDQYTANDSGDSVFALSLQFFELFAQKPKDIH